MNKRGFASDNNAGVSPEVLQKLTEVNTGHVVGYGDDIYTAEAVNKIKEHFGREAIPYFVFTGTAANVLSIAASGKPFNSVFTADTSHINVDECGAPERFSGCKVISISTKDGKLRPELLKEHMIGFGFEHHSQPGLISISQSTELGTVYTADQIKDLAEFVHQYGMFLHIDGARLSNAAVSTGKSFKELTSDCGVDILSFGGTKNGLLAAESVIFFRKELAHEFKYIRKQGMQLASKMRFIAAQFLAFFENNLWERNASHANEMAQKLYFAVKDVPGVRITQTVESNGVFACIPKDIISDLQSEFFFYVWNEQNGEVRWMTSFDTTEEDIELFRDRLKQLLDKRK
ncbi:MAG: low specificity L-threonine aldolase [Bacteroidales bacterium]|nr:low specificity L-threonine aldolase [Bacteroidales bacterium]